MYSDLSSIIEWDHWAKTIKLGSFCYIEDLYACVSTCIEAYQITHSKPIRKLLVKAMEQTMRAKMDSYEIFIVGRGLYFIGQDETVFRAIRLLQANTIRLCMEGEEKLPIPLWWLLPSQMCHEETENHYAELSKLVTCFTRFDPNSLTAKECACFLTCLADTIAHCSEQLYEHYRALVDLFRAGVRTIRTSDDESVNPWLLTALAKGLKMGLLNPEEFQPLIDRWADELEQSIAGQGWNIISQNGSDWPTLMALAACGRHPTQRGIQA